MKNSEIVEKYLAHIGYSKVSGESILPVMPFIVMDVVYNMYNKTIRPLEAKHELKRLKSDWEKAYDRFDRMFLAAFTQEEQDEIIDKMDSLEEYISNAKAIAEIQTMNCFDFLTLEQQKVLACANISNLLTHYSLEIWKAVYKNYDRAKSKAKIGERQWVINGKNYREKENQNKDLATIERASEKFMDVYYAGIGGPNRNLNNCPQMRDACMALVHKMYDWVREN